MRINEKLNLVVPVDTATGKIYVHSVPLQLEAFERYYQLIWNTFSRIIVTENETAGTIGAVRVAAMMLKTVANSMNAWEGPMGGAELMAELRRLSNVIVPGDNGWQTMPLEDAVRTGLLDPLDKSEVENAIVFFIVSSAMHRREMLRRVLQGMETLWDAQITSSNSTEFIASLPKLNEAENTGAKTPASSVPS